MVERKTKKDEKKKKKKKRERNQLQGNIYILQSTNKIKQEARNKKRPRIQLHGKMLPSVHLSIRPKDIKRRHKQEPNLESHHLPKKQKTKNKGATREKQPAYMPLSNIATRLAYSRMDRHFCSLPYAGPAKKRARSSCSVPATWTRKKSSAFLNCPKSAKG